jgi:hypothetical protein
MAKKIPDRPIKGKETFYALLSSDTPFARGATVIAITGNLRAARQWEHSTNPDRQLFRRYEVTPKWSGIDVDKYLREDGS